MPKRSLALDFLVAAYGPDKLADPTQAEPVVQAHDRAGSERAGQLLPAGQDLRRLGEYQLAEETYLKGRDAKPNDPNVYLTSAATTIARATSPSWSRPPQAHRARAAKTGGILHARDLLLGQASRDFRLTTRRSAVRARRSRGRGQGDRNQARLHGSHRPIKDCSFALRPCRKRPEETAAAASRRRGSERRRPKPCVRPGPQARIALVNASKTPETGPSRVARAGPFFLFSPRVIGE